MSKAIQTANKVYQEFLDSEKGAGFCGQVAIFTLIIIWLVVTNATKKYYMN